MHEWTPEELNPPLFSKRTPGDQRRADLGWVHRHDWAAIISIATVVGLFLAWMFMELTGAPGDPCGYRCEAPPK